MQLFKRKKVTIDSLSLPHFGWNATRNEQSVKQWLNPDQPMGMSLNFFNKKPDLPSLKNLPQLREFYRKQLVNASGGLIEVETTTIKGHAAIRTIFKLSQETEGVAYLASLTLPFRNCSYVIKIQAPEPDTSDARGQAILKSLLFQGKIAMKEGKYDGWEADPYDATVTGGTLMNQSEKPQYDLQFPQHALSQAREFLRQLESEILFSPEFEKIKPFQK